MSTQKQESLTITETKALIMCVVSCGMVLVKSCDSTLQVRKGRNNMRTTRQQSVDLDVEAIPEDAGALSAPSGKLGGNRAPKKKPQQSQSECAYCVSRVDYYKSVCLIVFNVTAGGCCGKKPVKQYVKQAEDEDLEGFRAGLKNPYGGED